MHADGAYYKIRQALAAAEVFDPLQVANMRIVRMHTYIYKLLFFGFPEFNRTFLEEMTSEAEYVKQFMKAPFDWDAVPGDREYTAKLNRKLAAHEKKQKDREAQREKDTAEGILSDVDAIPSR
jgi:hypothetical protein